MDARLVYLFVFAALFIIALLLQKRYCIICDASTASPKPYSYARLQLLWWTFIVLASFIATLISSGQIPTLNSSTLVLLGIGTLTTASARIIDISDETNYKAAATAAANTAETANPTPAPEPLSKDEKSNGFWLDILSDKTGISIHRFQAFMFNFIFGLWFIYYTIKQLKEVTYSSSSDIVNGVMPIISDNNLILLGLSAGTYAALKSTENK